MDYTGILRSNEEGLNAYLTFPGITKKGNLTKEI